jgi:lipopolysaccharide export system ATP-binding protein|tara:strand:- start:327 stop:1052 length:726 start_codon:yes stop_codon:yes gene_type:complete
MTLIIESLELALSNRTIVKNVTLNVNPGEVVGLLGPNGAGKTSTFNMIVGLIKPNKGNIFLEGNCIKKFSMTKRVQLGIGYLAQEPSIFRNLTVIENLDIALSQSCLTRTLFREKREELIEEFNLLSVLDRYGHQLSGGERRRCEVARALAVGRVGPKYLLLDEPFAGIDPIAINDLQSLISKLKNKNIGILITDHNVRATLAITSRAYILNQGEILAYGSSDQLKRNQVVKDHYLGNSFD